MRSAHHLHMLRSFACLFKDRPFLHVGWTLVKILKSGRIYHVLTLYAVNRILSLLRANGSFSKLQLFLFDRRLLQKFMRLPYL